MADYATVTFDFSEGPPGFCHPQRGPDHIPHASSVAYVRLFAEQKVDISDDHTMANTPDCRLNSRRIRNWISVQWLYVFMTSSSVAECTIHYTIIAQTRHTPRTPKANTMGYRRQIAVPEVPHLDLTAPIPFLAGAQFISHLSKYRCGGSLAVPITRLTWTPQHLARVSSQLPYGACGQSS